MPSRLTVVLVSLLVATPVVIFWLWLLILPGRVAIHCPEGCECEFDGLLVNCSGSGLNSIPSILPTDVRQLVLDKNNLTYFENDSFVSRGLVELEILYVEFCEIIKIELGAFNGLKVLKLLFMKGNELSEIITGTFEEVGRLGYLDLSYNRIEHLESDVFSGLVNLKYINMEGNKLQYLHPDTFIGLPNLQTLFVSKNAGLKIPNDRHFINSHSLKKLDISGCSVSSVSVETFANVSALELLDLRENNLRSVHINILKALPELSTLYLYGNRLQCDCQLQEVWRWCQDHNIQTAYKDTAPECDTPSEVKGIWWGVLEKGQCIQGNISYYGDYKNTSYSYTLIEDTDTGIETEWDIMNSTYTETEQFSVLIKRYAFPVVAFFCLFGTTFNVILIIIITCNKDMRTVPSMYILNLAVSDVIILTLIFFRASSNRFPDIRPQEDIEFLVLPFCFRISFGVTAYCIAVYSIQRYRVTVNPFKVVVSSQPKWRSPVATIFGVWIVATLFAIPTARAQYLFSNSTLLWRTNYYKLSSIFHLSVSCVLPLSVIAFSYTMTARHLLESSRPISEGTQNPQLNTRRNTAIVLLGLTVVFIISYVPFHIYETYACFSINLDVPIDNFKELIDMVTILDDILELQEYLSSINSCLNPVALFCTSLAFRRHFKRYLTCCCYTNSPPTDFELTNTN